MHKHKSWRNVTCMTVANDSTLDVEVGVEGEPGKEAASVYTLVTGIIFLSLPRFLHRENVLTKVRQNVEI